MSKIFEIVKISEMAEKLLVVDISVDMFKNSKDILENWNILDS